MLAQRWHRVVQLAYGWGWKYNVGPTCPYVNILSLAVGSITNWNQYVGPTCGRCTQLVSCFNMTELRRVHYVGPTLDQRMPATLVLDKSCGKLYVDPTLGHYTLVTWFYHDQVALGALRWTKIGPTHACQFGFG